MRSLFNHFDLVRIVSLPERRDRRADMARELRKFGVGIDNRIQFVDAVRMADKGPFYKAGSHGAYLSHMVCLLSAAMKNKSILILQDDCQFVHGAADYQVPDCDIFYGGYEAMHGAAPEVADIIGAHCMGFSAATAKVALDYLSRLLIQAKRTGERIPPIDGSLVWLRREKPELRTVFEHLAFQRSSRSDISPGFIDRIVPLRAPVSFLRRVKTTIKQAA